MSSSITLTVTHKAAQYTLSFLPSDTLAILQTRLEELTSVPPSLQKLLHKGKKVKVIEEQSLTQIGLKHGAKLKLLGSTEQEIGGLKAAETEKKKRDNIMRQREAKGPSKVSSYPSFISKFAYTKGTALTGTIHGYTLPDLGKLQISPSRASIPSTFS